MKQYRFRRWLRNWINNFDAVQSEQIKSRGGLIIRESDEPDHDKCLHFKVWFANGGKVIQTNRYDRHKDRSFTSMYVVTEDQEFGKEIEKIVTMETLRG